MFFERGFQTISVENESDDDGDDDDDEAEGADEEAESSEEEASEEDDDSVENGDVNEALRKAVENALGDAAVKEDQEVKAPRGM